MNAAENLAPTISEPLTWAEICARYPDEWVCLVEVDRVHPNGFAFRTARVIGHGKTRRAPVDQALPWRAHYPLIGHHFTGRIAVRPPRPSSSSMTRRETPFVTDGDLDHRHGVLTGPLGTTDGRSCSTQAPS